MEGVNTYLSSFGEFEKSRAAEKHPWLQEIRRAAIQRFLELGFPTTSMEEWRYTSVAPILNVSFRPAEYKLNRLTGALLGKYTFSEVECCRLVFLNGAYSEELSAFASLPRGCRVKTLSAALAEDRELVEHNLVRVAKFDQQAFTALNTAFMDEGAFVYIAPGTVLKKVIHLLFISGGQPVPTISHPRSLIVLGAGSQATVVESYLGWGDGKYFTNAVSEIVADPGSVAEHYTLQREGDEACHVGALEVLQERGSDFTAHSISLGGALVRNDTRVVLNDEAGECALNGLYVAKGRQHIDNHTLIDHARPHCNSRELYKGILDDASTGVFSGKIVVRQDAQKTNAKQTNRNLLLSDDAVVNTKPQLEIFADDVKCTHGATIGRLDEEQLFYMRSRGIGEVSARSLLTYAFASDILGQMKIKPIQCQIDLDLLQHLAGRRAKN